LRPKQPWDESRTLLQALREKYISPQEATNAEIVYISGKHAEEVGLEKLARRQAQLQGIHTLVLDRMCIRHRESDQEADQSVSSLCANITSLDIGGNLFESWDEVMLICRLFPRLSSLTLDGNRFHNLESTNSDIQFPNIRYLGLTATLLSPDEVAAITKPFPSLQTLIFANNELEAWESHSPTINLPQAIHSIDLSGNQLPTLTSLTPLLTLPNLHTLLLKANKITSSSPQPPTTKTTPTNLSQSLHTLDLRSNHISTWSLPTSLPLLFPSLHNLLIASNPLYASLSSFDNKPLTPSDGYTLTLARLPQLRTLNHSTITDKERLNAETYYLGQIARELAQTPVSRRADVLAAHPRWEALCEEYGEPVVAPERGEGEVDPASLGARFVEVRFYLAGSAKRALDDRPDGFEEEWKADIPRSSSVYALLGRVGKRLKVSPLKLRFVWETGERDPVRRGGDGSDAPEWWDSSDEEDEGGAGSEWVAREVQLIAGTNMVGSYFEGRTARVRVEVG
jgi:hypothetical protein